MRKPPLSLPDVLFAAFFLVIILFMVVVAVYTAQSKAGQPVHFPAPLAYLSIAFLACIAGVIFKKRWARILSIAMLTFIALSSILIIRLYFRRLAGQKIDIFVLAFYLMPLLISLWYLVYFNLRKVRELFKN